MELFCDYLDLDQIANSGQCFRWKKLDITYPSYFVSYSDKGLIITQHGNKFLLSCNLDEWNSIWKYYFDFDRDYSLIENKIKSYSDNHLINSFELGKGIRILKQDLWEVIFSFVISQNNNITRIKNTIDKVCNYCDLEFSNLDNSISFSRFPLYDEIPLEIFDDSSFGFGYRASYLKELCIFVSNNPAWLDDLKKLSYDDAMNSLLKIKGIGKKVANCICLFGLGHTESFPIDTHVKQLLDKYYPEGFDFSYFSSDAGIIQQYLFYYELLN